MTASLFSAADYATLAAIVFRPDYPGNATARGVVEAPNGDSAARDTGKRYSHVAEKYYRNPPRDFTRDERILDIYLCRAYERACQVATALGVPEAFMPSFSAGALRVLEYPPGAGSHTHTDFDLFTLSCYRNQPDYLVRDYNEQLCDDIDPGLHLGEIFELLNIPPGIATTHHVDPSERTQHSIVYFAIPDRAAVLPSGATVGDWLTERLARSRYLQEQQDAKDAAIRDLRAWKP